MSQLDDAIHLEGAAAVLESAAGEVESALRTFAGRVDAVHGHQGGWIGPGADRFSHATDDLAGRARRDVDSLRSVASQMRSRAHALRLEAAKHHASSW